MKIAITGGRDHSPSAVEMAAFETLWAKLGGTSLFHGNCPDPVDRLINGTWTKFFSVDQQLRRWAEDRGTTVHPFEPNWKAHGRAAGPIRNGEMVREADALIAFKGGRGTADCARQARARGIPVYVIDENGEVAHVSAVHRRVR